MLSLSGKKWIVRNENPLQDIFGKILENRGLTTQTQINEFLSCSFEEGLHDPYLLKDMEKAVERIEYAIEKQEKIVIYGDYDVDGITGTAILYETIKMLGGLVSYRIPHRLHDGYGLNNTIINELEKIGVSLIITVDCGISNEEQIKKACDKGIAVIISDHHTIPEKFPDSAYAVIHPKQNQCKYPFKELTGSGVAFKIACALLIKNHDNYPSAMSKLCDLAALGTIADLGPLTGENRLIVKYGLMTMNNGHRPAVQFLRKLALGEHNQVVTAEKVAFYLAPRLNAAGRMQSAYLALQSLITDDNQTREKIEYLEKLNQERRRETEKILSSAEEQIQKFLKRGKIIITGGENWHIGVIGLAAAKLKDKYNAPVIVMSIMDKKAIGSCRSPAYFNIISALKDQHELLGNFGGHSEAAGFSIPKENIEQFIEKMQIYAKETIGDKDVTKQISIECEIHPKDITFDTIEKLDQLHPCGIGNEEPLFLLKNVGIFNAKCAGQENKHLFFSVYTAGRTHRCTAFSQGHLYSIINNSTSLDLAIYLRKKTWNNETKIELQVCDMREINN